MQLPPQQPNRRMPPKQSRHKIGKQMPERIVRRQIPQFMRQHGLLFRHPKPLDKIQRQTNRCPDKSKSDRTRQSRRFYDSPPPPELKAAGQRTDPLQKFTISSYSAPHPEWKKNNSAKTRPPKKKSNAGGP